MPLVLANIFQPLIDVFEAVLKFFHDSAGLSWGWSIIALTITVRALLIPLTLKQFRSMQRLQQLSPEIKKLQEKYKDDRQRLNQEMMRFYQENKVNPLGSCLPLVAQLPVFLSLFYMLQKDLRIDICGQSAKPCGEIPGNHGEGFFFIPDLTDKATGGVLVALIVLYIGSQLASSLLMSTTVDKNQRRIMLALPLVFAVFIVNFPAGLILYWITTNTWTIVQQYTVRKLSPPPEPLAAPVGARSAVAQESASSGRLFGRSRDAGESAAGGKTAAGKAAAERARSGPPPPPPRKKKKRSGRRR